MNKNTDNKKEISTNNSVHSYLYTPTFFYMHKHTHSQASLTPYVSRFYSFIIHSQLEKKKKKKKEKKTWKCNIKTKARE